MSHVVNEKNAKIWKEHIEKAMQDKDSQSAYCIRNDLNISQYYYYKSRLFSKEKKDIQSQKTPSQNKFLKATISEDSEKKEIKSKIRISIGKSIQIEIDEFSDPKYIGQLLKEVSRV